MNSASQYIPHLNLQELFGKGILKFCHVTSQCILGSLNSKIQSHTLRLPAFVPNKCNISDRNHFSNCGNGPPHTHFNTRCSETRPVFFCLHRSAQFPVSVMDNVQPVTLGSLSDSIPRHFWCPQALGDIVILANMHLCLRSDGPALRLTSINLVDLKAWSLN